MGTLLSVAAITLAGCHWGTYRNVPGHPGPQPYIVTVKEQNSAGAIYHCQAKNPNSTRARAECALDVIRYACGADPIPGWDFGRCVSATDHASDQGCNRVPGGLENCAEAMRRAITGVLGDKECIAYEYHAFFGPSYGWFAVDRDFPGCP